MADEFDDMLDEDLELDDEMSLDDLGLGDELSGMGGESLAETPKTGREAVEQSLKDTTSSFKDSFTEDKVTTAMEIAKSSIPDSLSKESAVIFDAGETVKEEFSKAGTEIRKQARSTMNVMKRFLPDENEKVNSVLGKIDSFLGEDDEYSGPSKEQIQNESIRNEIAGALGEKQEASAVEELIKQQIESNRHKSQNELLAVSAMNIEKLRKFNNEITNNYYRKSLELQFQNLFVNKEQLEITKTGFDTFKSQLEAIVKNSALPEVVKVRNSERLTDTLRQRTTDAAVDLIYSDNNPLMAFKKNLADKVEGVKDKIVGGLSGTEQGLETYGNLSEAGMGGGTIVGMMGADYAKEQMGKGIGKLIKKSGMFNDNIVSFKDSMADISATARESAQNQSGLINFALNQVADMTDSNRAKLYTVDKKNPNDATIFDNRSHTSLTKVIPGLLAKIHSEVKTIRTGNEKDLEKELVYDHNNDKFTSKDEVVREFKKKVTKSLEMGPAKSAEQLINILKQRGDLNLPKGMEADVRAGLIKYLMQSNSTVKPSDLGSNIFLKTLPKDIRGDVRKSVRKIFTHASRGEDELIDQVGSHLKLIKGSLPSLKEQMYELQEMGIGEVGQELGITKKDKRTGIVSSNRDGLGDFLSKTSRNVDVSHITKNIQEDEAKQAELEEFKKLSAKDKFKKTVGIPQPGKQQFSKGGYTGDGDSEEVNGSTHGKEYVLNEMKLDKILSAMKDADFKTLRTELGVIAKDVHHSTSDTDLKVKTKEGIDKIKASLGTASKASIKLFKGEKKLDQVSDEQKANDVLLNGMIVKMEKLLDNVPSKEHGPALPPSEDDATLFKTILNKQKEWEKKSPFSTEPYRGFVRDAKLLPNNMKNELINKFDNFKLPTKDEAIKTVGATIEETTNKIMESLNTLYKSSGDMLTNTLSTVDEKFTGFKTSVSDTFDNIKENKTISSLSKKAKKKKSELIKKANKNKYLSEVTDGRKRKKHIRKVEALKESALDKVDNVKDMLPADTKKVERFIKSIGAKEQRLLNRHYKNYQDEMSFNRYLLKHGMSLLKQYHTDDIKKKTTKVVDASKAKIDNVKAKVESVIDTTPIKERIANSKDLIYSKLDDKSKAMLEKNYKKKFSHLTWDKFMVTEGSLMLAKNKAYHGKAKAGEAISNVTEKVDTESLSQRVNIVKQKLFGLNTDTDEFDGIEFISNYDDLDEEAKTGLKTEFFKSEEYQSGTVKDFSKWLAVAKQIDPGSLKSRLSGMISDLRNRFDPFLKARKKLDSLKNEAMDEVMGKITGTGLKELTLDQENAMRDEFFSSKEYKDKIVVDFDIWLKAFGYRRNGTSLLSRMKSKLSVRNILRKTRSLDRKIAGKVYKTAGQVALESAKMTGNVITAAPKAIGRGIYNTGRGLVGLNKVAPEIKAPTSLVGKAFGLGANVVKGTAKAGFGGLTKAAYAATLQPTVDSIPVNNLRMKRFFKDPFAGRWTEQAQEAAEAHDSKRSIFGNKTLDEKRDDVIAKREANKKRKEEKLAEKRAKKTKELNSESSLLKWFKARHKEDEAEEDEKEELAEKKARAEKKLKSKEKNKNRFLKAFSSDKETTKDVEKKPSAIGQALSKAKSLITPTTVLLGIAGILSATGITVNDLKNTFGKVKDIATGIWDKLKWVGEKIATGFRYVKSLPDAISLAIMRVNPFSSKEDIADAEKKLAMKRDGTYSDHYNDDGSLRNEKEKAEYENSKVTGTDMAVGAAGLLVANKVTGGGVTKLAKASVKGTFKAGTKLASKPEETKKKKKNKNKVNAKNKKGLISKLKSFMKSLKSKVLKKLGPKAGQILATKLSKKIAMRLVPFAGAALLAYDATMIAKYMMEGMDFKSAASKALLGFDVFSDTDLPKDKDGNPIKPDDNVDDYVEAEIKDDEKQNAKQEAREAVKQTDSVFSRRLKQIESKTHNYATVPDKPANDGSFFGKDTGNAATTYGKIKDGGWSKVKDYKGKSIGDVSAYFESGGRGVGTISSGRGDRGGVSYGTHQLASKTGTLKKYLEGSKYGSEFNGLRPGSSQFNAKWKEIAKRDPEGFKHDQEAYISKTHYEPQVKKLKSVGLNVENRSDAVKSAVYSASVQFGPRTSLIKKAMNEDQIDPKETSDKQVINSIYDYKKENNNKLFRSSSANVKKGTLKRAHKEGALVLDLLSKEGKDTVTSNLDKTKVKTNSKVVKASSASPMASNAPSVKAPVTTTNDTVSVAKVNTPAKPSLTEVSKTNNASNTVAKNVDYRTPIGTKPTYDSNKEILGANDKNNKITQEGNDYLRNVNASAKQSVDIQSQMLSVLGDISNKLNRSLDAKPATQQSVNGVQPSANSANNVSTSTDIPNPVIDLKRKKYS